MSWQLEREEWKGQDLSALEVVYMWADGLYVKAGIEDHRAALLVIIAATIDGKKILLACESGERESKEGWSSILRDLLARGIAVAAADPHRRWTPWNLVGARSTPSRRPRASALIVSSVGSCSMRT